MGGYEGILDFIRIGREGLELMKGAIPLLPSGAKRQELETRVAAAEDALKRSDAKLAKELGMNLCDCTFPPQVMLWLEAEKSHVCPRNECGRKLADKSQARTSAPGISPTPPPTGERCPYCGGDTVLVKENPHDHFSFAGWKTHTLKCVGCEKQLERQWNPEDGYKISSRKR